MNKYNNYKDIIADLIVILLMLMLFILVSCEISYIYVQGNNNRVEERQTEDVNVKVDSLEIKGLKGF